jgi:hypothetical protein
MNKSYLVYRIMILFITHKQMTIEENEKPGTPNGKR